MGVFLRQKLAGRPLTIVGDGQQSRDFVYVTDVARAFFLAAKTQIEGEIFNVGFGEPRTINELVKMLDCDFVKIPDRPGEPKCTWADISKIFNCLGWEPLIPLEEGVKNMINQISYWKDSPLWDEISIEEATKTWFNILGQEEANEKGKKSGI